MPCSLTVGKVNLIRHWVLRALVEAINEGAVYTPWKPVRRT